MARQKASAIVETILKYVETSGIESELPEIIRQLEDHVMSRSHISVTSAIELSETERSKLADSVTAKFGAREVRFTVDPEILSGFVIRFGDQVLDTSGRSKLSQLARQLSA